jgi:hypothetical protein
MKPVHSINLFSDLGAWFARKRREKGSHEEGERTIREAVEKVVDGSDPKIRLARGYREKLGRAVEEALFFADALVEAIPGPIEVGKRTWATDPYVRAFFASVDEMREVLRLSREMEAFFKEQPFTECYALLTMRRREQTVLGTDQVGEIIRREVPKTAVSFLDHRIVSPCGTEAETRAALKTRVLSVLSEYAHEKIQSLRAQKEEIQAQKEVVKAKLKVLREEFHDSGIMEGGVAGQGERKIQEARDLLAEIDRRIEHANVQVSDPEGYLDLVVAVLSHPGDYLKPETVTLRLNPMGIKVGQDSSEAGGEIALREFELNRRVKRIAVLIKVEKGEVILF